MPSGYFSFSSPLLHSRLPVPMHLPDSNAKYSAFFAPQNRPKNRQKTQLNHVSDFTRNRILTITGTVTKTEQIIIRVCEGGTLVIDGGTLLNANLQLIPGCHLIIRNNGCIRVPSGSTYNTPVGAIVDIESGSIF